MLRGGSSAGSSWTYRASPVDDLLIDAGRVSSASKSESTCFSEALMAFRSSTPRPTRTSRATRPKCWTSSSTPDTAALTCCAVSRAADARELTNKPTPETPREAYEREQDQQARPAKASSQPLSREGIAPPVHQFSGSPITGSGSRQEREPWICGATSTVTGPSPRIRSPPCSFRYRSVREWALGSWESRTARGRECLYSSRCTANATPRATTTVRSTTGWRRRASATPMNPPAALIGTMTRTASHDTGPKKAK